MLLEDLSSDLSLSAVDKELGAGNETRVGGGEENGCASDVFGTTDAPEGDGRGHVVEQALLFRCIGAGQINEARR